MKVNWLEIKGLAEIQLQVFGDERGFFVERFKKSQFVAQGLDLDFCQVNHSRSAPGVLRGLHYQHSPGQGKLVGVTRGAIWDVAVDLRRDSPAFGQWYGTEINDENFKLIWIPPGFAHGFCVLGTESADVVYHVDREYCQKNEGGIRWDDGELRIRWPLAQPFVSARDRTLDSLEQHMKFPEPNWKAHGKS